MWGVLQPGNTFFPKYKNSIFNNGTNSLRYCVDIYIYLIPIRQHKVYERNSEIRLHCFLNNLSEQFQKKPRDYINSEKWQQNICPCNTMVGMFAPTLTRTHKTCKSKGIYSVLQSDMLIYFSTWLFSLHKHDIISKLAHSRSSIIIQEPSLGRT